MSITITATAYGSPSPFPAKWPNDLTNGDFLIHHHASQPKLTGTGEDEETTWTFNFAGDHNFPFFSPSRPLSSALLTLTLEPKNYQRTNDAVGLQALGALGGSAAPLPELNLPTHVISTIRLQLLDRTAKYTSSAILGVLFGAGGGQVAMTYNDDALISMAKLELIQESPAFQYAAKFVCGKSAGHIVAPGVYFTAVNVHNPKYEECN